MTHLRQESSVWTVSGGERLPSENAWILIHMIEETSRHAEHCDILREQTNGQVGD